MYKIEKKKRIEEFGKLVMVSKNFDTQEINFNYFHLFFTIFYDPYEHI